MAPLDLDQLLAFHRSVFGGIRMEATDDDADGDADKGADGDAGADGSDGSGDADKGADGDAGALGDAGKKALDAMKAKWQKERDARKAVEAERDELKKPKDGDQPDAETIRSEASKAATAKANERIIRSEVKAAAAGKLADPADAYKFLDLSKFEVDDDGNVDEDEIADAVKSLLESKPYLGVTQGDEKRFKGGADGGQRGTAGKPQLSEADVKSLAAQGKHDEIETARVEGRLNTLLGIT